MKQLGGGELSSDIRHSKMLDAMNRVNSQNEVRDRGLLAFTFLMGGRIAEIVRFYPSQSTKEKVYDQFEAYKAMIEADKFIPGIKKDQVSFDDAIGLMRVTSVRTLKRKRILLRTIPIPYNEKEAPFVNAFRQHYDSITDQNAELFPITRIRAYQIFAKAGIFPHLCRHSRNSILVAEYDYGGALLQRRNGWARASSADPYMHLNMDDELRKLLPRSGKIPTTQAAEVTGQNPPQTINTTQPTNEEGKGEQ
jgi:integrase